MRHLQSLDALRSNPESRLRWLLVVGILLCSVLLPLQASAYQLLLALGALAVVGVILVVLRWPPVGLVALVYVALIAPAPDLPGGLNIGVLFLGLLIVLWLWPMIVQRRIQLVISPTVRPLLAIVGSAILAFIVGQLTWFVGTQHAPLDTQLGGLAIFVLAAGAFLLVAHQIHEMKWLQWLTWSYVALTSLQTLGWIAPGLVRGLNDRLLQPGTTNNSMFWLWLVAITFSQTVYNNKLHIVWRVVLGSLFLATMYVVFFIQNEWKSGYLPAFVAIAAIIAARSWRIALVLVLTCIVPAQLLSSQAVATDEYSYSTRLDAWLVILQMIKFNPVTGFGPGNYSFYTHLFPLRGYNARFNSHNQYLDIIAQIGILGLICFLWFAWEIGWLGWHLRDKAPSGFARAYIYGALGGLAGMLASGMLVDWFLPYVYNIGLTGFRTSMLAWVFLGGVVSIERIVRHQEATSS
ncbi:MAG: hypothetical protein R3C14_40730 [Caldilineaceae bacterium]